MYIVNSLLENRDSLRSANRLVTNIALKIKKCF